jgi:hypothetical protein
MPAMNKYLVFFLLLACTNSFAAISKWVDSDGQVHYSDQPPPSDVRQKTLRAVDNTEDSQSASSVAAPKTLAEREAELKKSALAKKEAAEKAAQKQAAAAVQQANCTNAQQNLKTLQSGIRIMGTDANGQPGYIDDSERDQRVAKAQSDISTYCK